MPSTPERRKQYYLEHAEEIKAKKREYNKRPEVKERSREWHREYKKKRAAVDEEYRKRIYHQTYASAKKNWSRLLERARDGYARNKDKILARNDLYRRANPDKIYQISLNRKLRVKGAAGYCTLQQWIARLAFYGERCAYCGLGLTLKSATRDHVIAVSKGGSNWPSNLVPCCRSCNTRKHSQSWYPQAFHKRRQLPA